MACSVRAAKSKGASMEYDTLESLQALFPKAYLTKQRGFQLQYDIQCDEDNKFVVECKRLKGISWNQAVSLYTKTSELAPLGYESYLIFKSNNQPALVMHDATPDASIHIQTFESFFNTPFIKHTPIRKVTKAL
jgi:hypothetical protein